VATQSKLKNAKIRRIFNSAYVQKQYTRTSKQIVVVSQRDFNVGRWGFQSCTIFKEEEQTIATW
jgi:hypothetical protein